MTFVIVSTLVFAFIFFTWSTKTVVNVILKVIFGALLIWGVATIVQTNVNPQVNGTAVRLF